MRGCSQLLQEDGRRPYAELGAAVGISGPAAHERVKKLEQRGVITGYEARVSAEAVGLGVLAFTWVTQAPGTVATDLTGDFGGDPGDRGVPPHHGRGGLPPEDPGARHARSRAGHPAVQATRHVFSTESDVVFSTAFERRPIRPASAIAGHGGRSTRGCQIPVRVWATDRPYVEG